MLMEGVVRRFQEWKSGKGQTDNRITHLESVPVAQVEPAQMDGARAGRRFWLGNNAAITGIAPVQALVTTAAQWALWNPDSLESAFLEELGVYLTSGTPGVGGELWACLFTAPAQSGALAAGSGIQSASNGKRSSGLILKSGVTITSPAAPVWYPVASNPSPNVTAFASSVFLENRNLQGGIVIPPLCGLGLAVVAPAGTTPLFAPFAKWFAAAVDME